MEIIILSLYSIPFKVDNSVWWLERINIQKIKVRIHQTLKLSPLHKKTFKMMKMKKSINSIFLIIRTYPLKILGGLSLCSKTKKPGELSKPLSTSKMMYICIIWIGTASETKKYLFINSWWRSSWINKVKERKLPIRWFLTFYFVRNTARISHIHTYFLNWEKKM